LSARKAEHQEDGETAGGDPKTGDGSLIWDVDVRMKRASLCLEIEVVFGGKRQSQAPIPSPGQTADTRVAGGRRAECSAAYSGV